MTETLHPSVIFIFGAVPIPWLKGPWKKFYLLFIPSLAFLSLLNLTPGTYWQYPFLEYELTLLRVDKLSLCFGYIFVIIGFLGMLYALHIKEDGQHIATFLYIGSSLGTVFAGDFFSLFVFFEIMAVSAVFLIWYNKEKASLEAGFRYILMHIFGGGCLLAGIIIHVATKGSIEFRALGESGIDSYLILIGFSVNAAIPPLGAWLPDSYPEGTVTGSVFLSAYTTKAGVYVLIRAFSGMELLAWLGAIMAIYGVIFAMMENDIRRLLSYHIISQVGYMVCGIGLGTEMAINGTTAHAWCHILYKALLFMAVGAVIQVTGKRKLTELEGSGLYQTMGFTLIFYIIGAFSISSVPGFNGFVSKSITITAAGLQGEPIIELMLHLASIGTFLSIGLKLPYFTWFGKPRETIKANEPPSNMLLAMMLTSSLCIFIGIFPRLLYRILPYPITYQPYTADHIVSTIQLLLFTAAAFWLWIGKLAVKPAITLDTDWFYRRFSKAFSQFCCLPLSNFRTKIQAFIAQKIASLSLLSQNPFLIPERVIVHTQLIIAEKLGKKWNYLPPEKIEKLRSLLQEIEGRTYDENLYRRPIGIGVLLAIIFFFLYNLIYIGFIP
jgi:multicomponent Na+:H+ antiporter subunit D